MRKLKYAVFIVTFTTVCLAQSKQETFASIKQKYLNRKIVIIEEPVTEIFSSWHLVTWPDLKPKKSERLFDDYLPTSYAGRPATVVSIAISDNPILSKKPKANALGEMPGDDQIIDPYVELFVRFDDGTTAQWSTSASTAYLSIKTLPDTQQLQSEIETNAESLVGKTLYAVHNSYLYSADTDITKMVSAANVDMMDSGKFPFLTPLTHIRISLHAELRCSDYQSCVCRTERKSWRSRPGIAEISCGVSHAGIEGRSVPATLPMNVNPRLSFAFL